MKIVSGNKVRESLHDRIRVYLSGNLSNPEPFEHVQTDGLEIGISRYDTFTPEKAHIHKWNYEYNYLKCGSVKVYNFSEEKEYTFGPDDMYVIEPGMAYITKAQPGTEVIFVKSPGGNDKVLLPVTEEIIKWSKEWESKI